MSDRAAQADRVGMPRSVRQVALDEPDFFLWDEEAQEVRPAGADFARGMAARRAVRRERRRMRRIRVRPESELAW
jgi:hypothetical protein